MMHFTALLAAAFVGTVAGFAYNIESSQTATDAYCKKNIKSFIACSKAKDYSIEGGWDDSCQDEYDGLKDCTGWNGDYVDNSGTGSDGIVSTFINKAGHLTGYASLAEDGSKIFAVDCNFCSKFVKKATQCMIDDELDINVPGGYYATYEDCASRDGLGEFIYKFCRIWTNEYEFDAENNNVLTWAYVTVNLGIDDDNAVELCPTVKYEAVGKNGKKFGGASAVKIIKGSAYV